MKTTATFLFLIALLFGCSRRGDPFAGYQKASGDLVPFVMGYAIQHGGRPLTTNGLPQIQAEWKFKPDSEGVQIYLVGDYFPQVQAFLRTAFGSPAMPANTNNPANILGGYAVRDVGVAIQFGRGQDPGDVCYTKVLVIRAQKFP